MNEVFKIAQVYTKTPHINKDEREVWEGIGYDLIAPTFITYELAKEHIENFLPPGNYSILKIFIK